MLTLRRMETGTQHAGWGFTMTEERVFGYRGQRFLDSQPIVTPWPTSMQPCIDTNYLEEKR
jgi:hypothetical protein